MSKTAIKWVWLTVIIIILDQLSKVWISQSLDLRQSINLIAGLDLTLVHNTGAAFSFLSNAGGWQRWFFIVLSSSVSIALLIWIYQLPVRRRWLASALALVLGGALGNLWDRIVYGYVIDFIDVYYQDWHWPAFNIADSAITIGAVMLVIDAFWFDKAFVNTAHIEKPDGR